MYDENNERTNQLIIRKIHENYKQTNKQAEGS